MKSYVFTMGVHEDFAIRRLVSTNATREDDVVCLFKSPMTNGNKRALNALNAVMSKMGLREAVAREVRVSGGILDVVDEVTGVLNDLKDPLVVDVSGGESKAVMVGVVLSLAINGRAGRVYVEEDEEYYFSVEDFRTAVEGVKGEALALLINVVAQPGIRYLELAEKTGKKLKTVMNSVGALKKKRLVYQKGRGEGVYPTKLGVIVCKSSVIGRDLRR